MAKGRATADILAEWREVERLAEHADDPFERAELLRRARDLRWEYASAVDELSDVSAHGGPAPQSTRPEKEPPGES
jgi:hypothetical protein